MKIIIEKNDGLKIEKEGFDLVSLLQELLTEANLLDEGERVVILTKIQRNILSKIG